MSGFEATIMWFVYAAVSGALLILACALWSIGLGMLMDNCRNTWWAVTYILWKSGHGDDAHLMLTKAILNDSRLKAQKENPSSGTLSTWEPSIPKSQLVAMAHQLEKFTVSWPNELVLDRNIAGREFRQMLITDADVEGHDMWIVRDVDEWCPAYANMLHLLTINAHRLVESYIQNLPVVQRMDVELMLADAQENGGYPYGSEARA